MGLASLNPAVGIAIPQTECCRVRLLVCLREFVSKLPFPAANKKVRLGRTLWSHTGGPVGIYSAEPYGRYCNTNIPASLGVHFFDSFQEQAPDGLSEMKNPPLLRGIVCLILADP